MKTQNENFPHKTHLTCMCHKMSKKKGVKLTKFRQAQEQWWFCECSWVFISARLPSCPAGHILSLLSRVPPTYNNITAIISPPPPPCCVLSVPCFVLFSFFFLLSKSLSHCLLFCLVCFLSLFSWHVSHSASETDSQKETLRYFVKWGLVQFMSRLENSDGAIYKAKQRTQRSLGA